MSARTVSSWGWNPDAVGPLGCWYWASAREEPSRQARQAIAAKNGCITSSGPSVRGDDHRLLHLATAKRTGCQLFRSGRAMPLLRGEVIRQPFRSAAGLHPVEQARKPAPLRGGDVSGDCLHDDAAGLDLETGCLDLLQLVGCRLTGGGDAEVGEG